MVKIFIPKERADFESRVAITPEIVKKYLSKGYEVLIEKGAGLGSHITDDAYTAAGAVIVGDVSHSWKKADIIFKVAPFEFNDELQVSECSLLKEGAIVIGLLAPYKNPKMIQAFEEKKITSISMEFVPRITRAQTMDALSSQANIAGYKAVLIAAAKLDKYFPQLMTAAGTVRPAKVVIIGAGVAGLQAIATARRLGAVVEVSDIRPEVKEQVMSLGGKYIEPPAGEEGSGEGGYAKEVTKEYLAKQQEILSNHISMADVVISTALVPGRPAPKIITEDMVKRMNPGSIIIDLAVSEGGNCPLSVPNKEIDYNGVTIIGDSNLPSKLATDASNLYARNIFALSELFLKNEKIEFDFEDEIIKGSIITHGGEIVNESIKKIIKGGN
ncbi:MAG: Re/Si-specific NAD(P)(+) transhydrogenase subunit alpha [Cyclobacteriaceae bacterium]|nr:Re/Si-specific NAD(P)(+) transhydrogenase subunit alpha [Cyclobacteriaceae bacterium]